MEPKIVGPRSAPASAAEMSMVLGDHDLLCEILVRVTFPDSLVRAAAVCRRWLRAASDPALLRRFRDRHDPRRLLGFYLTVYSSRRNFVVEFVPAQPDPPPGPETAAILRRARFSLDGYTSQSTRVLDCRAGRVLASLFPGGDFTHGVHTPLNPAKGLDVLPQLPMTVASNSRCWVFREMLSKETGDGEVSYIWFTLDYSLKDKTATSCAYLLQDGAWHMLSTASTTLDNLEGSALKTMSIFLTDNKIYMGITRDNVIVLDLTSSTFSEIEFHDEMPLHGEVRLAPGNGSEFYFVGANNQELCIWLHRGGNDNDNDGGEDWSLLNTISLSDLCSDLNLTVTDDPEVYIHEVWDNANFVLIQMHGCVFCLNVKSRGLQKIYEVTERDKRMCFIHPFMMTWPPIFPALNEG